VIAHIDQEEFHRSVARVRRQPGNQSVEIFLQLGSTIAIGSLSVHHDHEGHTEDNRDLGHDPVLTTAICE
jgi:hypothetical protein